MERKVVNDAVAYIRGLAELRGRNADWAEQAVRGAASLSATAALKQNVIDVVARDLPDLLTQIDGREVKVGNRAVKLATRDLVVVHVKPDWRTELLSVITNPPSPMAYCSLVSTACFSKGTIRAPSSPV
jgi:membrane-bound serine protease (ClpP class)